MAIRAAARTDSRLAARCAALASLGAGAIHVAAVPVHWREWVLAGAFFGVLAAFQLLWARVVLIRTTVPVLLFGVAANVGAIVLWAFSRTAGVPFGPHAGQAEVVQAADLCALLLQIYVVMGSSWIIHKGRRGDVVSPIASAFVLVSAAGIVALASTVGVVSGQRHGDHHGPAGNGVGHHESDVAGHDTHHHDPAAPSVEGTEPAQPLQAPSHDGVVQPEPVQPAPLIEPVQPPHDHAAHDH